MANFRHPLGLHAVQYDQASQKLLLFFPPGLDRLEQLQFSRDAQERLVAIADTYWQYAAAARHEEVSRQLIELQHQLVESATTKSQAAVSSLTELNRRKLAEIEQINVANSRYAPPHPVGDSGTHLQRLLAYMNIQFDCRLALHPATDFSCVEAARLCVCCSVRHTLESNPDLLIERARYLAEYRQAKPTSRWALCSHSTAPSIDLSDLPNTSYDVAAQKQQALEIEVRELWSRMQAGSQSLELLNKQLAILEEQGVQIDSAINQQLATREDRIANQIQIHQTLLRAIELSCQLLIARDKLLYRTATLCEAYCVQPVNFWYDVERRRNACE